MRWTEERWGTPTGQHASIAVQNIGTSAVSGVVVRYLNASGQLVGQHALPTINPGAKKNSSAVWSDSEGSTQPQGSFTQASLQEFGYPLSNGGSGFGGSVLIEGPAGSQLSAVVRIASRIDSIGSTVAEDFNAIPVQ
ncbi:MAG: hypothetical protein R2856_20320 [Caldilineaceae bacterium]